MAGMCVYSKCGQSEGGVCVSVNYVSMACVSVCGWCMSVDGQ